jgi:hypothetical protein
MVVIISGSINDILNSINDGPEIKFWKSKGVWGPL